MAPTASFMTLLGFVLLASMADGRQFYQKDEKGVICDLLDAEFTIHFSLLDGTKILTTVDLNQDFPTVFVGGNCNDTMALAFGEQRGVQWEFDLRTSSAYPGELILQRSVLFQPYLVFGELDPTYDQILFETQTSDDPVLPDWTYSFVCAKETTTQYQQFYPPPETYNYAVSVTVSNVQVQVGHMDNGNFGPAVSC